jgi:excinuclease ABC subunit C
MEKFKTDIDFTDEIDGISFSKELLEKIYSFPTTPGVYFHKNSKGQIIYIGKAKNLRNRVKNYYTDLRHKDPKTLALIKKIADTEYIVVDSEAEALILEDTMVKKHKPHYNIMLRDDKSFPYIRITNEEYPRIFYTRILVHDGSKYFGPYTDVRNMKFMLQTIMNVFQLRTCNLNLSTEKIKQGKYRVCLENHIKKCDGVCGGLVNHEEYMLKIKHAQKLLAGKMRDVLKFLKEQMEMLSEEQRYEEAAVIRNRYFQLFDYSEKQKVVALDFADRDIFGLYTQDNSACSIVLKIREGKLIGKRHFIAKNAGAATNGEIIQRTVESWYRENEYIPKEICLSDEAEDMDYLTSWLGKLSGKTTHILIPRIGDKRQMVEMANTNAEYTLKDYLLAQTRSAQAIPRSVDSLKRDLRLARLPRRIECFDNSHIQGTDLVSSMVVFLDGKPQKSEYRKFKLKTVLKNDDFAAMRETLTRRYTRAIAENTALPDLLIVDGGKGQLSSAVEVLTALDLFDKIPVIGLAKRLEEVFVPGSSEALMLPRTSSSLKLLQQLRDEAHRFAITFHRSLRDKRTLRTELTEIQGIGETTAKKLLTKYGSIDLIKELTKEQLTETINKTQAEKLLIYFKNEDNKKRT